MVGYPGCRPFIRHFFGRILRNTLQADGSESASYAGKMPVQGSGDDTRSRGNASRSPVDLPALPVASRRSRLAPRPDSLKLLLRGDASTETWEWPLLAPVALVACHPKSQRPARGMRHVRTCYRQCQVNSAFRRRPTSCRRRHRTRPAATIARWTQSTSGLGPSESKASPSSLRRSSSTFQFDDAANVGCVLARPGRVSGLRTETAAPCNTTRRLSWRC
jgi:hypothetical protein